MECFFEGSSINMIRCVECQDDFLFDSVRGRRYFLNHFKGCHLRNLLPLVYKIPVEESRNMKMTPKRKEECTQWLTSLNVLRKRQVCLENNLWEGPGDKKFWSCRLCFNRPETKYGFTDTEEGRCDALIHLKDVHVLEYNEFIKINPEVAHKLENRIANLKRISVNERTAEQRRKEAERSRLRRLNATPEQRRMEALRSKRRRENSTPAQKAAEAERRKKRDKRKLEALRSKMRRQNATEEEKEREIIRNRERRKNATPSQREAERLRSIRRRKNQTEEQKARERERCKRRYLEKKRKLMEDGQLAPKKRGRPKKEDCKPLKESLFLSKNDLETNLKSGNDFEEYNTSFSQAMIGMNTPTSRDRISQEQPSDKELIGFHSEIALV